MKNDLVSIITPSYKSADYIEQTIESVLNQTHLDWEMIIVDDLSPDKSNIIIDSYVARDSRISLLRLSQNRGPAVARNVAIEAAKGRYIAFLDADDLWYPDKLEKQVAFMQSHDCALSYTSYELMNKNGIKLNRHILPPIKVSYDDLLKTNCIGCLTAMYDTSKIGKVYMPNIRKRQDYGLWLKILKLSDYAYGMEDVLSMYRVVPNSVSSNKLKLLRYNYELFRYHEKLSFFKSVYCLGLNVFHKLIKSN